MLNATVFFPTRDRPDFLGRTLESIETYCAGSIVYISNCSSKKYFKIVDETIDSFRDRITIKKFEYEKDPGTSVCYNDMFQAIETSLALVWADDMIFLKNVRYLYDIFEDPRIQLVALPMIDDISAAPSITAKWPVDEFGCAIWDTATGRCAHHSIVRTSFFQQFENVYSVDEYIDNFFHHATVPSQRYWPEGSYVLHTRIDDKTRLNMLIRDDTFRFYVGHPGRGNFKYTTREERDADEN